MSANPQSDYLITIETGDERVDRKKARTSIVYLRARDDDGRGLTDNPIQWISLFIEGT